MSARDLPARANLENLRKQAKALHRAFLDGDADAVQRIRDHLPRAEALPDGDSSCWDLSLQETQHVLAKEYGRASWDDLKASLAAIPPAGAPEPVDLSQFDDLARLDDREAQALLREIFQKDLSRALIGAPRAVRGRMLSNMSRRVRGYLRDEMERLSANLPDHEPAASRQRMLEWAQVLGQDGRITWPPVQDARAWDGEDPLAQLDEAVPTPGPVPSLEDFTIDDLAEGFGEMAAVVRREGILALEEAATAPSPLQEGIRLAVDGTQPELIEAILATRRETMVRNRQLRLRLFEEGVASIQAGDNPFIVRHKIQVHYLDAGVAEPPERYRSDMTAGELRTWLERGWILTRTPGHIADLFLHLACCARFEGIAALGEVLDLIEPPFLRQALTLMLENREAAQVRDEMAPHMERELNELEAKLRAIGAGVMGIARRLPQKEVEQAVRSAAGG